MTKKVYIYGDAENPQGVIQALVNLGAIRSPHLKGERIDMVYYINTNGLVDATPVGTTLHDMFVEYGEVLKPISKADLFGNTQGILTWRHMEQYEVPINGYYLTMGTPTKAKTTYTAKEINTLFFTKRQAAAALAFAKITQLIELPVYGGWVPCGERAYIIDLETDGEPAVMTYTYSEQGHILRFRDHQKAELFLENNRDLVRDFLMVNS